MPTSCGWTTKSYIKRFGIISYLFDISKELRRKMRIRDKELKEIRR